MQSRGYSCMRCTCTFAGPGAVRCNDRGKSGGHPRILSALGEAGAARSPGQAGSRARRGLAGIPASLSFSLSMPSTKSSDSVHAIQPPSHPGLPLARQIFGCGVCVGIPAARTHTLGVALATVDNSKETGVRAMGIIVAQGQRQAL